MLAAFLLNSNWYYCCYGELLSLCQWPSCGINKIYMINCQAGLEDALRRLQNPLSWIERMDVTVDPVPPPKVMLDQIGANPEDLEGEENINNDFKRESKL